MHDRSSFSFLQNDFQLLANIASSAELLTCTDPVTALIKLRQFGEIFTNILYDEHGLDFLADNTFHNRLKDLDSEGVLPYLPQFYWKA